GGDASASGETATAVGIPVATGRAVGWRVGGCGLGTTVGRGVATGLVGCGLGTGVALDVATAVAGATARTVGAFASGPPTLVSRRRIPARIIVLSAAAPT